MNVQVEQISDLTDKWELAERISGHANAPQQALQSIFKGAMDQLEEISQTKFDLTMQDRVWNSVSKKRLATLKETFILAFCEKILGGFKDKEIKEMLEEHKRTGFVKSLFYSGYLQTAYTSNKQDILETVIQKADSMTNEFIPEIINAVKKEGIQLPERK